MKWGIRLSVLSLLAVTVLMTGCASSSKTERQINSLQAQVGVLTDELIRLDQGLQTTRGTVVAQDNSAADYAPLGSTGGDESVVHGIYRTPGGFELPSISIQQALKNAGYYSGALDGKIGPGTRSAIREFQRDNGLKPDGIVGRNSWQKLKAYATVVK